VAIDGNIRAAAGDRVIFPRSYCKFNAKLYTGALMGRSGPAGSRETPLGGACLAQQSIARPVCGASMRGL
jgi:hypothetical protein